MGGASVNGIEFLIQIPFVCCIAEQLAFVH